MKKSVFYASAAAVLVLAACNKEASPVQAPEAEGQKVNLTLVADRDGDATKTTIENNANFGSLESKWAKNDKVYVYSINSGNQLGTLTIDNSSITNENGGTVSAYATSKATFSGKITLGGGDTIKDDFAFVYQGSGRELAVSEGLLTYSISPVSTPGELAAWDVAYKKGKIQGSASSASCAVSFENKVSFGYFSTTDLADETLTIKDYYSSFTLNVKDGSVEGVKGEIALEQNAEFYMPLVLGKGSAAMSCGRKWNDGKTAYKEIALETTLNVGTTPGFYRHGKATSYGPVQFAYTSDDFITYDNLASKSFKIANSKTVRFTPGNLRYYGSLGSEAYWALAPTQYDYLGNKNTKPEEEATGYYTGDIDLFGWGEVGTGSAPLSFQYQNTDNTKYMESITTANQNFTPTWATKFNAPTSETLYIDKEKSVSFSAGEGKEFYCLTKDDWVALFNSSNQKSAKCVVTLLDGTSTVNGVVVAPSDVTDNDVFKGYFTSYTSTVYTANADAYSKNAITQKSIEDNGLLFLPAAGYRNGTSINGPGTEGYYWSTTSSSAEKAYNVSFYGSNFYSASSTNRFYGFSVRLAVIDSE